MGCPECTWTPKSVAEEAPALAVCSALFTHKGKSELFGVLCARPHIFAVYPPSLGSTSVRQLLGLGLHGWRIGAWLGGRFTVHALYRKGVQRESRREEG